MCIANMTVVKTGVEGEEGEEREEVPTASNEHPDSIRLLVGSTRLARLILMGLDIGIIYNVDLVSGLYPDIM